MNKYRFNKLWECYDNTLANTECNYADISYAISDIEEKFSKIRADQDCAGIEHEIEALFTLYKELFLELQSAWHYQVIIDMYIFKPTSIQSQIDDLFINSKTNLSRMAAGYINSLLVNDICAAEMPFDTEALVVIGDELITRMRCDRFRAYHNACKIYLKIHSRKTCLLESDLLGE